MYIQGWLCDTHRPGPQPPVVDPTRTAAALRAAVGFTRGTPPHTAIDTKHIASGKRRSNLQGWRTAQDATGARRFQEPTQ
jgi:hypothetical protein